METVCARLSRYKNFIEEKLIVPDEMTCDICDGQLVCILVHFSCKNNNGND